MVNQIFIKTEDINNFCCNLFNKLGMPKGEAKIVAEVISGTELLGIWTHGLQRIPILVKRIEHSLIDVSSLPEKVKESKTTAVIDGKNNLGQLVMYKAMKIAIKKAYKNNVAVVGVRNSNNFGAAGYYSLMATEEEMIGMVFSGAAAVMPPTGGKGKKIGNDPMSIAIPSKKDFPIFLDIATSEASYGKIKLYADEGKRIPKNWGLNSNGENTDKPQEVLNGGCLLPMATHKGYGLAVIIDILSGILTGAVFGSDVGALYSDFSKPQGVGHLMIVINIKAFIDIDLFKDRVNNLIKEIKDTPLEVKENINKIFLPGEIEYERKCRNLKIGGVNINKGLLDRLDEIALKYGISRLKMDEKEKI